MKKADKNYGKEYFQKQLGAVGNFTAADLKRNVNWFLCQLRYFEKRFNLDFDRAKTILEVGCAIAGIAHIFAVKEIDAFSLDISSYAVKRARKLSPEVHFAVNDIQKGIPFKRKFDFIFAFEVLEHLGKPLQGLINIKKSLQPDGKLIATTPYPFKKYKDIRTHVDVLLPQKWKELMEKAGFKKVDFQPVTFLPCLYRFSSHLGIIFPFNSSLPLINSTVFYVAE